MGGFRRSELWKKPALRVIAEQTEPETETTLAMTMMTADPASVRPSLALAAAENLEAPQGVASRGGRVGDEANLAHRRVLRLR